jgi:hypothetical protein
MCLTGIDRAEPAALLSVRRDDFRLEIADLQAVGMEREPAGTQVIGHDQDNVRLRGAMSG